MRRLEPITLLHGAGVGCHQFSFAFVREVIAYLPSRYRRSVDKPMGRTAEQHQIQPEGVGTFTSWDDPDDAIQRDIYRVDVQTRMGALVDCESERGSCCCLAFCVCCYLRLDQ